MIDGDGEEDGGGDDDGDGFVGEVVSSSPNEPAKDQSGIALPPEATVAWVNANNQDQGLPSASVAKAPGHLFTLAPEQCNDVPRSVKRP